MLTETASASETEPVAQDGRRNRTVETRKRITEAFIALIREGHVAPTADAVSARAGVGLRTVFRHFDDMETLYHEANAELENIITSILKLQYTSNHWQDRVLEGIVMRAQLFEAITPFVLAGKVHRHESRVIDASIRDSVALERAVLAHLLPPAACLENARFEALLMVLSPEAWMRLRREQGQSVQDAITTLQWTVKGLMGPRSPQ